jgi:short subunit dehydrogenase-like uncharacterized protein
VRDFDVVVYGATGFTGQLVAEYMAKKGEVAPERWALAGRNTSKLEAVRDEIAKIDERLASIAVVQASADDPASLRAMAAQTKVVLTTVGPFIRYGEPLVEACVAEGTHYVDITGEPEFVTNIERRFGEEAKAKKLKIVSCCGFDSIPHDLGVLYTVEQLAPFESIEICGYVWASGNFSGGTWNSAVDAFERMRDQPKAQHEAPVGDRKVGSVKKNVHRVDSMKRWAAPMPTIDPQIVKKSARRIERYGKSFRYGHYVTVKSLPTLVGLGAAVGGAVAVAQVGPGAKLLRKLKSPGEGPTPEERAKARFSVTFEAVADGNKLRTRVSGGDPGYDETAKMIAESAACIAFDDTPDGFGVTTTAHAMGQPLIDRLVAAGMVFETLT